MNMQEWRTEQRRRTLERQKLKVVVPKISRKEKIRALETIEFSTLDKMPWDNMGAKQIKRLWHLEKKLRKTEEKG